MHALADGVIEAVVAALLAPSDRSGAG